MAVRIRCDRITNDSRNGNVGWRAMPLPDAVNESGRLIQTAEPTETMKISYSKPGSSSGSSL